MASRLFESFLAAGRRDDEAVDPVAVRRITPFVRPLINPDELPPDYLALLSLTFGVAGLMLKVHTYVDYSSNSLRSIILVAFALMAHEMPNGYYCCNCGRLGEPPTLLWPRCCTLHTNTLANFQRVVLHAWGACFLCHGRELER